MANHDEALEEVKRVERFMEGKGVGVRAFWAIEAGVGRHATIALSSPTLRRGPNWSTAEDPSWSKCAAAVPRQTSPEQRSPAGDRSFLTNPQRGDEAASRRASKLSGSAPWKNPVDVFWLCIASGAVSPGKSKRAGVVRRIRRPGGGRTAEAGLAP